MRPEIGKESAQESYEEIKSALEHADIVLLLPVLVVVQEQVPHQLLRKLQKKLVHSQSQ